MAGYQAEAFFDRGSRTGVVILKSSLGGPFDTSVLLRAVFEKATEKVPEKVK